MRKTDPLGWDTITEPDDTELHRLQCDYGHRWRIWRGLTEHHTPGDWHAMLADPTSALRGVRATSAQGLRRCMAEIESARWQR